MDNDTTMKFPGVDTIKEEPNTRDVGQRLYQDARRQQVNRQKAIQNAAQALDTELANKSSRSNPAYDSLSARASKSAGKESWMTKSKDDRYASYPDAKTENHLDRSVENPFLKQGEVAGASSGASASASPSSPAGKSGKKAKK